MTTWRELLQKEMLIHKEEFDQIAYSTMTLDEMDVEFDDGFGCVEGIPFTIWTDKRVYFPVKYDGSEKVSSVARFPDGIPTNHIGGGG